MFEYSKSIDRTGLYDRLSEQTIVERYKRNYGIDAVSFDQVRHHAELEGELTDRILLSVPDERTAITSGAYSTLYRQIDWLTGTGGLPDPRWRSLLRDNADVYEIGSGAGKLAKYLNDTGVNCVRTDISAERNSENQFGRLQITDGVNLSQFVDRRYDFVISDQVVEHLHPEDIIPHFCEARKILKPDGCYIFRAPNAHCGPQDLSLVFGLNKAVFMHLHEFTWKDVQLILKHCGFSGAQAIFTVPGTKLAIPSRLYFNYLTLVESVFASSARFRKVAKFLHFPSQVWVRLAAN